MPGSTGLVPLRGFGAFDRVFQGGKSLYIYPFRILYRSEDAPGTEVNTSQSTGALRVGIAVPKKRFPRAVDRNLIRRRIREAYRLNASTWGGHEGSFSLVLVYAAAEILAYEPICLGLCKAMKRWSQKLSETPKSV